MNDVPKGLEPANRQITSQERDLIEWLLHHGVPGLDRFIEQVEALTVIWNCSCGCPTINFDVSSRSTEAEREVILADYLATVDGKDVGIILFQRGGRLSSLEVYSQAGNSEPFGLPAVETIYSYEELASRQAKER